MSEKFSSGTINSKYTNKQILRKFKFRLDRKWLEKIFFSFVRPVIEYAEIIWDNIPDSLAEKIEKKNII